MYYNMFSEFYYELYDYLNNILVWTKHSKDWYYNESIISI